MSFIKLGHVVWHDLFTDDENSSKCFYRRVAGWSYLTEHATDFAWGGGEKDFTLALSSDEAGAGFVGRNSGLPAGWVPYIEVQNVDSVAVVAVQNGGSVVRPPFDVPGVGRNCLLRDPCGAYFGISLSRHNFPAPTKQFGIERYLAGSREFPIEFYGQIFGWRMANAGRIVISSPTPAAEATIAVCNFDIVDKAEASAWLPSIRVTCLDAALDEVEAGGGTVVSTLPHLLRGRQATLIVDPDGASVTLVAE